MFYQKHAPSPLLAGFVECYYIWEATIGSTTPLAIESPPSAFSSIVFNYGDCYNVSSTKVANQKVPSFFMTGQAAKRYSLQLSGTIGMVGIVFKPAAMSTFFNLPMYEFVDERAALHEVLGKEIEEIGLILAEASSHAMRIRILDTFLLTQLRATKEQQDFIDIAANAIVAANGNLNLDDLLHQSCMSRRQFERKFLYKVGLSPKYYARLRRIGSVCKTLAYAKTVDWHDIIDAHGFYDQSHFVRDFKAFMDVPPSRYFKHNKELVNFLED